MRVNGMKVNGRVGVYHKESIYAFHTYTILKELVRGVLGAQRAKCHIGQTKGRTKK